MSKLKKKRLKFIYRIYELSGGNETEVFDMFEIGSELGFNRSETDTIVQYLVGEYLLKHNGRKGISITHDGVKEIEAALSDPDQKSHYFPPINIINIHHMQNSNIQQGTSLTTQSEVLSPIDKNGQKMTRVERFFKWCKNHSIISVLIIIAIILIGLGSFTDSIDRIIIFTKKYIFQMENKIELDNLEYNKNHNNKEFINITRNDIIESLKDVKTELQKNNLAKKLYYGKYVKWTGKIQHIKAESDNKVVIYWPHGYAICDNSEVISSLQEGMTITLSGKITWYDYTLITIEDCELIKIGN